MAKSLERQIKRLIKRQAIRSASGKPFNRASHLALRRKQLTMRETRHEMAMKHLLTDLGLHFKAQKGFLAGSVIYIADFYLPDPYYLVIEVDGASHSTEHGIARDIMRDTYFKKRGIRVLHIPNEKVDTISTRELRKMIDESRQVIKKPSYIDKVRADFEEKMEGS